MSKDIKPGQIWVLASEEVVLLIELPDNRLGNVILAATYEDIQPPRLGSLEGTALIHALENHYSEYLGKIDDLQDSLGQILRTYIDN